MLTNASSDSDYSSKSTVLVIVAFTKRHISKKDRAASRANTQPFSEYFSVHTPFMLILCIVFMLSHGKSKLTTPYV